MYTEKQLVKLFTIIWGQLNCHWYWCKLPAALKRMTTIVAGRNVLIFITEKKLALRCFSRKVVYWVTPKRVAPAKYFGVDLHLYPVRLKPHLLSAFLLTSSYFVGFGSDCFGDTCTARKYNPRGYNTFFILNSAEHEIYLAHKC